MLDNNTEIKVTNRSRGTLSYMVPDMNVSRWFEPNETKTVTFEELKQLSYSIGGRGILEDYLVLDNKEAIEELIGEVEPEYFYTENDIRTLLEKGSLDQLDDCLTFGQEGVRELVKKIAIDTKLNDVRKRELIRKKTGFDITKALELSAEEEVEEIPVATRKANPIKAEVPTGRKAAPPKYNITSMK